MWDIAALNEFLVLRKRFHEALREYSEKHKEPGKMYEGEMELQFRFPGIYDEETEPEAIITAHVYQIGPNRHYEWRGKTGCQAVKEASEEIEEWIKEAGEAQDD